MRIATYNIQYGRGKDGRFDIARVVEAVESADIIALQEVERFWPRTGMVDQPAEIAARLPQHYWVYAPFFDMHVDTDEETEPRDNRRRQFGPMLLSRRPILWSRAHHFRKIATFNRFNMDTGALEGIVETKAGPVRFFSLHLSALDVRERLLQAESLLAINERARLDGPPLDRPSGHWRRYRLDGKFATNPDFTRCSADGRLSTAYRMMRSTSVWWGRWTNTPGGSTGSTASSTRGRSCTRRRQVRRPGFGHRIIRVRVTDDSTTVS